MSWHVEYIPDAENDLRSLDRSQQIQVLKLYVKLSGYPRGIRLGEEDQSMRVIVKSVRDDNEVYHMAASRIEFI